MTYQDRWPCGSLRVSDAGGVVALAGWVDALRDHGELLFIHLRDRSGVVQVIFSPEFAEPSVMERAATLRSEFCVSVRGRVQQRTAGTENPGLDTGAVEVMVAELVVLSRSEPLPFVISEKAMVAGAGVRGGRRRQRRPEAAIPLSRSSASHDAGASAKTASHRQGRAGFPR